MKDLLRNSVLTFLVLTIASVSVGQIRQIMPPIENLRIVIKKKSRCLQIFDGTRLIKTYRIVLGFTPDGDKQIEGDGKTPEGKFYVFTKNAESKFHLSLGLSYPNIEAAQRGLQNKTISLREHDAIIEAIKQKRMPPQKTALGGEIYIHGGGIENDWTEGCIALRNEEIEEIFEFIPVGAEIFVSEK